MKLLLIDWDEALPNASEEERRELTTMYCSGCHTTQKPVGTYRCTGDGIHVEHELITQ